MNLMMIIIIVMYFVGIYPPAVNYNPYKLILSQYPKFVKIKVLLQLLTKVETGERFDS